MMVEEKKKFFQSITNSSLRLGITNHGLNKDQGDL